jgi:pimeloyl-ACP methyl ester carboxylesterase
VALRFDVGGVRTSVGDVHDRAAHLRELGGRRGGRRFAPGCPATERAFVRRTAVDGGGPATGHAVGGGLLLLAPATRVPRSSRDFGDLLLGRPIRDAALDAHSLARLAAIPVPARILVGERDNVAPPDEVRAHAAAIAPVVVLAGVNHFFSRAVGAGATAYDLLGPAIDAAWSELVR